MNRDSSVSVFKVSFNLLEKIAVTVFANPFLLISNYYINEFKGSKGYENFLKSIYKTSLHRDF